VLTAEYLTLFVKVTILFAKMPIPFKKVRLLFYSLRVLNKIKLTLNKATKKPQIKWLVIVRRRVNVVRLELNLVVAKRCGAISICVFISVKLFHKNKYLCEVF
jgi:hypothetical protein